MMRWLCCSGDLEEAVRMHAEKEELHKESTVLLIRECGGLLKWAVHLVIEEKVETMED